MKEKRNALTRLTFFNTLIKYFNQINSSSGKNARACRSVRGNTEDVRAFDCIVRAFNVWNILAFH